MLAGLAGIAGFASSGGGAATDPNFSSVVFLSGFEGADGSTTMPADESPSAHGSPTAFNGAQLDTAQFKFGASSLLLDGTNDFLILPDSDDWCFGTGDFTVELWARFSATSGFRGLIGQYVGGNIGWWFQTVSGTSIEFGYSTNGSSVAAFNRSWSPSTNTWYHICAERSGTTMRLYVNGAMLGTSGTNSANLFNASRNLDIGVINGSVFGGWLDEIRITKGVARYASDSGYTVPTAAFPRS